MKKDKRKGKSPPKAEKKEVSPVEKPVNQCSDMTVDETSEVTLSIPQAENRVSEIFGKSKARLIIPKGPETRASLILEKIWGTSRVSMSTELPSDPISFLKAEQTLRRRYPDTTLEEIAMWACTGKLASPNPYEENRLFVEGRSGFTIYIDNPYLEINPRILLNNGVGQNSALIISCFMHAQFSSDEIEAFVPDERWLTYDQLLTRWSARIDAQRAQILIETYLFNGVSKKWSRLTRLSPTKEHAMFALNEVQSIEEVEIPAVTPVFGHNNSKDWHSDARAIADELHRADFKAGAYSSLQNISERVAVKMRERGIKGPRGPLSAGTILREAIQAGKWKRPNKPK